MDFSLLHQGEVGKYVFFANNMPFMPFKQQANLKNDNTRTEALHYIKTCLLNARGSDIAECASFINVPLLFSCLKNENENEEQIDLTCDILTICMDNLGTGESINRYGKEIEKSLSHRNDVVRQMSLKEILRTAENDANYFNDISRKDLVLKIVNCVGHDNLSIAHVAVNILCLIVLPWLQNPQIMSGLQNVMELGEIQRFRVYEIMTRLASKSKGDFDRIEATSLLSKMLGELDLNDELVQLNIIELLTQLALCDHGFFYLEHRGVFKQFATQIENIENSPLSRLVLPGLIKFFGRVAHWKPVDMLNKYKKVVLAVMDIITNSHDETLLLVTMDTFGYLAVTKEGKIALNNIGDNMEGVLKKLGSYMQNSSTAVKIRSLECVNHLVCVEGLDSNNEIQTITSNWFNKIVPVEVLFNICKNPFPDTKLAALTIFKGIANQLWGADLILNNPGIIEYLLDRRTGNSKDEKQLKYDIIFALSQVPNLDVEISQRLRLYVSEGPFYVETMMDVAVEGD